MAKAKPVEAGVETPIPSEVGPSIAGLTEADVQRIVVALARFLYTVRFKSNRGVQEVLIAAHPDQAPAVAKQWVNKQPGRILLQLFPTIVADETILNEIKPVVPAENSLEGR